MDSQTNTPLPPTGNNPEESLSLLESMPHDREFPQALSEAGLFPLKPKQLATLQINLGKLCNLSCLHCHVGAGPDRKEIMSRETMEHCLNALDQWDIPTVDITGGAPEMNPHFRWLLAECAQRGKQILVRTNLVYLTLPIGSDLPELFARHQVHLFASLPHYRQPNTDRQRGEGVFEKSILALKRLNQVGYGLGSPGKELTLVTNPVGAFLPASQSSLEAEWKSEMKRRYSIDFDTLIAITNLPISRYLEWLASSGNLDSYYERLVNAFNPLAAQGVMCRDLINVGWDGKLYDCDFNQMLGMEINEGIMIDRFDGKALAKREIRVGRHCYGCTAGAGSSCSGATVEPRES